MPSILSRLFGAAAPAKAPEPVLYKDCRIFPAPIKEGGSFRVAARIEKDFSGQVKTHHLVRADTFTDAQAAAETALAKARQAIDQLGDSLFG